DWSSDVCSSDLRAQWHTVAPGRPMSTPDASSLQVRRPLCPFCRCPGEVWISVQVHDLELQDPLGARARGRRIPRRALRRPRPEALLAGPAGDHEVAVLAADGAQQLEALEAGRLVDGVLARGEALLELRLLPLGHGEAVDLDDGHRVLQR